jgi:hypothetical protein
MKVKKCGHTFDVAANFLNKAPSAHQVECAAAVFCAWFRNVARVRRTSVLHVIIYVYTTFVGDKENDKRFL